MYASRCHEGLGDRDKALAVMLEAQFAAQQVLGSAHPHTLSAAHECERLMGGS